MHRRMGKVPFTERDSIKHKMAQPSGAMETGKNQINGRCQKRKYNEEYRYEGIKMKI